MYAVVLMLAIAAGCYDDRITLGSQLCNVV